jgi:hypothetical protein
MTTGEKDANEGTSVPKSSGDGSGSSGEAVLTAPVSASEIDGLAGTLFDAMEARTAQISNTLHSALRDVADFRRDCLLLQAVLRLQGAEGLPGVAEDIGIRSGRRERAGK